MPDEQHKAIVIFYEPNYKDRSIKEIGRTAEHPLMDAMEIYSETPNPASQLLSWRNEEEKAMVLAQHEKDIVSPNWLGQLFECI